MNTATQTLSALFVTVLLAGSVQANPITVLNHSFESPNLADGGISVPSDWLGSGGGSPGDILIDRNTSGGFNWDTNYPVTPDADGEQFIFSNGADYYQVLTATL